ncbi:MAG: NlpC/P60 family protein [Syntrophales bacterium]|nr:NlpC/P60 family protein [Syntrophales bacterium]
MIAVRPFLSKGQRIFSLACIFFLLAGCAAGTTPYRHRPGVKGKESLARMRYTVQVGAFSKAENASRLTETLRRQGIDATYFVAEKGLYKVRFGNYPSRAEALRKAEFLKAGGVIDDFYIVSPSEYAAAKKQYGESYLRDEIVRTAKSFIGVPYLWGGNDADTGFDCSGLTMTVYQLNGLDLPRTSREQAEVGSPVTRNDLSKGDLVFFRTRGEGKVSHVGIYAGDNRFIHAPGKGKKIRVDSLSRAHFQKHYAGGRSYM